MPTYQYLCNECGQEFEVVQSFSDEAISTCEKCQGAVRKVYNSVGIVFKGSGFYKTDSRSSSNSKSDSTPSTSANTTPAPAPSTSSTSTTSTTSSSSD
ncbi:MAG: FmdB family transcriptional regulator [Actinobacteria bacterium]|nr:FmdB family transcriptional regulator [Actinomycetota bacterium]